MWRNYTIVGLMVFALTAPAVPEGVARASPAAQTLRIGYSPWVGYGPLFLARDKRLFAEPGLEVKFERIDDPKRRFAALAAAELDGLVTTIDTMSLYWRPTAPFRAVLALDESRGEDGIVAAIGIKSIEDLRGKRVAVNLGSVSDFFLNALLREHGMTESDLDIVNMRQDDAGTAFVNGQVDAAVTWEPWLSRAQRAPGRHVLIDTRETPGLLVDVLLFRQDVITAQPGTIKAMVAGWYGAVGYWKRNPDDADRQMAQAVGDWLGDVKTFKEVLKGVAYYDQAINDQYMAPGGRIYATAQTAIDIWTSLGRIHETIGPGDLIDPQFITERQ